MALSLFSIFNALVPKDGSSRKIGRAIEYGPARRHRLDIYSPVRLVSPAPVVFFVYGGSWMDGDRRNYDFAGRAMAALGYVTVIADYRLVPEVEFPLFLEDCAKAFEWVAGHIGEHGGDPGRIALMGHSAGAYNALMLALHPRYLRSMGRLGQVRCMVGLSGPYDFLPFDGPISLRTFGAADVPADTQPVNHVTGDLPPAFLASGERDQLVYPRNAKALAGRLRDVGVTVEERYYPRLGHAETLLALSVPARRIAPVREDVAAFLRRYL